MDDLKQLGVDLLLWLCLATPGLVLLAWMWLRGRDWRQLLPPQRTRAVPWSGFELVAIFVACTLWSPMGESFLTWMLGEPAQEERALRSSQVMALVAPFQLATVFLILWTSSGTRLYQLGLTTHRLGRNILLGYLAWMVFYPAVSVLNYGTTVAYEHRIGHPPPPHPLTELIQAGEPALGVWCLLGFLAVVAAPLIEELLFRGVLLFWLSSRHWGSNAALSAMLVLAMGQNEKVGLGPFCFALALLPGYVLLPQLLWHWMEPLTPADDTVSEEFQPEKVSPGAGRASWIRSDRMLDNAKAVYASAAVFAIVHPWPTPIPLFLLGLGLGWLAYRTRSLVGPIVLHALFNGTACVELWLAPK